MRILVSNDDGVHAQGLIVLANALAEIAEVTVVAPDRNRSGASNSLTLQNPLRIKHLDNGFISVEGTPTDCVHLALTSDLLSAKPDMVVAGINAGANLGDDVFYSGTVAAAMEGCFLGLPAVAFSAVSASGHHAETQDYELAAKIAKKIVSQLQANPLPAKTMLNVNIPDVPSDSLEGYAIARLGARHNAEPTLPALDPRGQKIYWIGPAGPEQDAGVGTDFYAIASRQVAITPLQLDLTHYALFSQLAGWVEGL